MHESRFGGERRENQWFCFSDVMFEMSTRHPGDNGYTWEQMSLEFKGEIAIGEVRVTSILYNA